MATRESGPSPVASIFFELHEAWRKEHVEEIVPYAIQDVLWRQARELIEPAQVISALPEKSQSSQRMLTGIDLLDDIAEDARSLGIE